ncbi:hypothetical protein PPSIR1_35547 [Plesiocystis pacifica SIR-1]|uniref:Glycosyltransferase RgtA/B/C/D-like domain-containing protein n=2 Tax=Plesiocystis pacifica TaxID=191768 RepID=A6GJC8_9BACT|nr:hypothetical protein PPSIR1_35547 [Plesiocystis pacifica SIR-1]
MLAFMLLISLAPRMAAGARPVIGPDREREILSLLEPHALGDELTPGWTLHSFSIDVSVVELWIVGPDQVYAEITLEHPDYAAADARQLEGFALRVVSSPPGSEGAVAELVATIEGNDDGSFWGRKVLYAGVEGGPSGEHPLVFALRRWSRDGLVLLGVLTVALLVLTAHALRGAEAWMKWSLLAVVLLGAALRVSLAPEVALAPWSYTRALLSGRLIYEGPLLGVVHPGPVWMSETILDSTLALALLAPLAIYVHARYLLGDHRVALIAAGVLAFLPLHLRFSHSDVAFIPSITLSSFVITLVHVAMREPKQWLAWSAVVVVGFPLALVYLVRPLNILYFPLLIGTMFVNAGVHGDKPPIHRWRAGLVCLVLTLVTVLGGIPWLLLSYEDKVVEGLQLRTLLRAARVMFHPSMNALLNPVFTPPGLTLLAVFGAVDLRRRGRRGLLIFLVLWLLGFLVTHAYFVPMSPYMQARYHLHLVVPFVFLAACGAEAALRWLARERERRSWLAGRRYPAALGALVIYVLASPLIHLHGVRYADFNEAQEWRFVHSLREEIPAECSVIEYIGGGASSRIERVGAFVEGGAATTRWRVLTIPLESTDANFELREVELPEEVRAAIEDPPDCLYWYEGLLCAAFKPPEFGKAPACAAVERELELELVVEASSMSVPYDYKLEKGLGDLDHIDLRLFRVRGRRATDRGR